MNIERARELAAQCWCDPRTSATEMDVVLAEVFAERLMHLVNSAEALYMAGRWTLPEYRHDPVHQAELWESLRFALGLEPGHSTLAEVNSSPLGLKEALTRDGKSTAQIDDNLNLRTDEPVQ